MITDKRKTIGVFMNKADLNFQTTVQSITRQCALEMGYDVFFFYTVGYRESSNFYDEQEKSMFNFKRFMSAFLAIAVVISMGAILGACGKNNGSTDPTGSEGGPAGEKKTYTVTVHSAGGMALSDVGVSVYADSTKTDMKDHRTTDADGKVTFQLPASDNYAIELSGLPKATRYRIPIPSPVAWQ